MLPNGYTGLRSYTKEILSSVHKFIMADETLSIVIESGYFVLAHYFKRRTVLKKV